MVDTLETALAESRLTLEEFRTCAVWAFASWTHGDLAAVTVGIPPRREAAPVRTARTDLDRFDKKSFAWGVFLILMPAALGTAFLTHYLGFLVLFVVAFIGVTVTAQPDS